MPVVFDRNLLGLEVGRERVGREELGDRLLDPADAPQVVAEHVPRVRYVGAIFAYVSPSASASAIRPVFS